MYLFYRTGRLQVARRPWRARVFRVAVSLRRLATGESYRSCRLMIGLAKTRSDKVLPWVCRSNSSSPGWLKDVRANCFCASLLRTTALADSHATSCIERACQVLKWAMIGQMAIAIALLGYNDLGRSVTPPPPPPSLFFSETDFIYNYLHNVQKWIKNQCGKLKKFQDFCPRDMESCHLAAARRVKLCSLNANLYFEEPHQLTEFA